LLKSTTISKKCFLYCSTKRIKQKGFFLSSTGRVFFYLAVLARNIAGCKQAIGFWWPWCHFLDVGLWLSLGASTAYAESNLGQIIKVSEERTVSAVALRITFERCPSWRCRLSWFALVFYFACGVLNLAFKQTRLATRWYTNLREGIVCIKPHLWM